MTDGVTEPGFDNSSELERSQFGTNSKNTELPQFWTASKLEVMSRRNSRPQSQSIAVKPNRGDRIRTCDIQLSKI
jgi:hypothetical protein